MTALSMTSSDFSKICGSRGAESFGRLQIVILGDPDARRIGRVKTPSNEEPSFRLRRRRKGCRTLSAFADVLRRQNEITRMMQGGAFAEMSSVFKDISAAIDGLGGTTGIKRTSRGLSRISRNRMPTWIRVQ